MNKDQINGKWEQIKGRAKALWGDLTEDDFTKAQGSADALYGTIQKKFGDTKEQIQIKIDQLRLK